MKALLVYESMFGNTEEVARAVAVGLAEGLDVEVHEVSTAPEQVTGLVDLIVVGGPTHAFSLSRPATRADALAKGATRGERDIGVREWLTGLRARPHLELMATFDTRTERVRRLPGSAAQGDRLGSRTRQVQVVQIARPAGQVGVVPAHGKENGHEPAQRRPRPATTCG
jgi:hypothetical protein